MKLVIASDIHGSAQWCKALLQQAETFNPDALVLLGDLLYHGPRNPLPGGHGPGSVAEMLNAWAPRIIAVRGNCDAEIDQVMLDFPCMADYAQIFDGSRRIFLTHGHLWSPDHLPPLPEGSVFLSGHTHVKADKTIDGIRCVNPGSTSLPKDGTRSFCTYDDGVFSFHQL